jgi:hypothetical protein
MRLSMSPISFNVILNVMVKKKFNFDFLDNLQHI